MRTTILLLGINPRRHGVSTAVERVACSTGLLATPKLLLHRPTMLPILIASMTIEWKVRRSVRAPLADMVATPLFLVFCPAILPIREALLTIVWHTSSAHHVAAPSFLLCWPSNLVIVKLGVTIINCARRCDAPSSLMLTTPLLFRIRPRFLPVIKVSIAVVRIASATNCFATPLFLLLRPSLLPTLETVVAIESAMWRRGYTSAVLMSAAPILFGLGPSFFPNCEFDVAVEWSACSPCRVAAPSLLLCGPLRFPFLEMMLTIEGHVWLSLLASLAGMVATPLLLLDAPACFPLLVARVAVVSTASMAGRSAAKGLLFACPTLLPMLYVQLAVEQQGGRCALAPLSFVLAAPSLLTGCPRLLPMYVVMVAIILVATLSGLHTAPGLFGPIPVCFPFLCIDVAIV